MFELRKMVDFEQDSGGAGAGGAGGSGTDQPAAGAGSNHETDNGQASFAEMLKTLPENVQQLYAEDVKGLKTALNTEREQRKELAGQLADAAKKLAAGSDERKALEAISGKLEAAEQRAQFYEEALKPEVKCRNPKLAYLAAQTMDAFDNRGNINWDVLKREYPELFGTKIPDSGAGQGGNQNPPSGKNMNTFIRKAAGR